MLMQLLADIITWRLSTSPFQKIWPYNNDGNVIQNLAMMRLIKINLPMILYSEFGTTMKVASRYRQLWQKRSLFFCNLSGSVPLSPQCCKREIVLNSSIGMLKSRWRDDRTCYYKCRRFYFHVLPPESSHRFFHCLIYAHPFLWSTVSLWNQLRAGFLLLCKTCTPYCRFGQKKIAQSTLQSTECYRHFRRFAEFVILPNG